jgi:hypothetical protein
MLIYVLNISIDSLHWPKKSQNYDFKYVTLL